MKVAKTETKNICEDYKNEYEQISNVINQCAADFCSFEFFILCPSPRKVKTEGETLTHMHTADKTKPEKIVNK